MGVSPSLQSCIGKDQLMVKKDVSCSIYHFIKYCNKAINYGSELNCSVIKVGVALAKMIAHIVINTQWCFL